MTKAFDSALRLLVRREHGALELCRKLEQKGFSQSEAKSALEACQRLELQSDSRYVENYSRSRIHQGYGPLRIIQELKNKGIDSDLIHETLSHEAEHWNDHALRVWKKKCKGQQEFTYDDLQKMQRFMLYRGFEMDIISQIVKQVRSENE